jgi:hypothetical protein
MFPRHGNQCRNVDQIEAAAEASNSAAMSNHGQRCSRTL